MKVVVAIDSFKGSLSSLQAGNAVKEAIMRINHKAEVLVKPLADGGEGTVDALAESPSGETVTLEVHGPRMKPVAAKYCILKDTNTAVIEMASASGITLLADHEKNPLETTTYGVGELIKDAIGKGCRRFLVGIGGSATNDGGCGCAAACGCAPKSALVRACTESPFWPSRALSSARSLRIPCRSGSRNPAPSGWRTVRWCRLRWRIWHRSCRVKSCRHRCSSL